MFKVKFVLTEVKSQGQGHEVKIFDTERKILSQGTQMCNKKAFFSFSSKVMLKVIFLSRSKVEVK